ncbi:MAG: DUF748 domain-containing protein [Desulfovibrionaceae bacterium]
MPALFAAWKKMRLSWKLAWVAGVLFVLYVVAGFLVVPPLAKRIMVSAIRDALHRDARVEAVQCNPLTLQLEVRGFAIMEKDGSEPFVSFTRLAVNLDAGTVFTLTPSVSELRIEDPYARIVALGENTFNFSDLILDSGNGTTPSGNAQNGKPVFPALLTNLTVSNGTLAIVDTVHDKRHTVTGIDLAIPFTSTLPDDSTRYVEPVLRAVVNGNPLELKGKTLPFADTMRTDFTFSLHETDLTRYWDYVPLPVPVALLSGFLTMDVSLSFERGAGALPALAVSGVARLSDVAVARRRATQPFAGFSSLAVDLERFRLLEQDVHIRDITLERPFGSVVRQQDGSLDLVSLLTPPATDSAPEAATGSMPEPAADGTPEKASYVVTADRVAVVQGSFTVTDQQAGGFRKTIAPVDLTITDLSTQPDERSGFSLAVGLRDGERVRADGSFTVSPLSANGTVTAAGLSLPAYAPYYQDALPLALVSGTAGAGTRFAYADHAGTPAMRLDGLNATVGGLALRKPGAAKPDLKLEMLTVAGGSLDLAGRAITIGSVALRGVDATLVRNAQGEVDVVALFAAQPKNATAQAAPTAPAPKEKTDEAGWKVRVNRVDMTRSKAVFRDLAASPEARFALGDIALAVRGVALDGGAPITATLAATLNNDGTIATEARLTLSPFAVHGVSTLKGIALAPATGYLPPDVPVRIDAGTVSAKGAWDVGEGGGAAFAYRGDVGLDKLFVSQRGTGRPLMALGGLDVAGVDTAGMPLRLAVDAVRVRNLSCKDPQEGANVAVLAALDLGATSLTLPDASAVPDTAGNATGALAIGPVTVDGLRVDAAIDATGNATIGRFIAAVRGSDMSSGTPSEAPPSAPPAASPDAAPDAGAAPQKPLFGSLTVDRVSLTNGLVTFADATVSPAYTVAVQGITAAVAGFDQTPGTRTAFSVNASLDGSAPIMVDGSLVPSDSSVGTTLSLTLANMDMAPLSPYTAKYIAYPLSTGKLAIDTRIQLTDGALDMGNVFRIAALTLGERVKSPDAPNLPIKLGLALLADRDGNMQLDVPVKGRIDDPQFRLGKVIFGAILNLFGKIVTAPFALLGNLFSGGGGQDGDLAFAPGSATLDQAAMDKLAALAKALTARPRLRLELTGYVDRQADTAALEERAFQRQIKQPRYTALEKKGKAPASVDAVTYTPEEYPDLLRQAYEAAPFAKPKNVLGMVKDQPVEVMEQALREHAVVDEDGLRALAMDRARAAQEFLLGPGGVAQERVFLKLSPLDPPEKDAAKPKTRVEMGLR